MNIEELAFKDRKILANLNAVDLLNIIEFLQDDRRQCLEELSKTHNRSVEIQKENQELKSQLAGTTHCFDEEEHNKLKEEITNLSKEIDMWNSKYNDMFDENRELKKQLEERPKEYVFIGNAQNKTRDFINQITKNNKDFKNQQKEFIEWLENEIDICDGFLDTGKSDLQEIPYGVISANKTYITTRIKENETAHKVYEEILQKYRSIIGDDK